MRFLNFQVIFIFIVSSYLISCGVKGPPLPPAPATPQASDSNEDRNSRSPAPSPSPTNDIEEDVY